MTQIGETLSQMLDRIEKRSVVEMKDVPEPEKPIEYGNIKTITVAGQSLAIRRLPSFWEWLNKSKNISRSEFSSLSVKDREKMFLRWKWGSSNDDSNRECESTRRGILGQMTDADISRMDTYERHYWSSAKEFDRICRKYKSEIGITG